MKLEPIFTYFRRSFMISYLMSYLCVIRSVKKMDGFYSNLNAQIRDDSIQTVHDHFPAMTCY